MPVIFTITDFKLWGICLVNISVAMVTVQKLDEWQKRGCLQAARSVVINRTPGEFINCGLFI